MKKLSDKPKSAFAKWRKFVDDVKKGKILNSVKAAKLAASLSKIPVRIMKDGNDRILGGGSKIKGVLRGIMKKLSDKPKSAFAKWRKFVESIKKGKILDNVKAQKLAVCLAKIPVRILKDGNDRILGGGSKIKGVLRGIIKKLAQKPKTAFERWRLFVNEIKKGKILDNVKAQKLAVCLAKIPVRRVKDANDRILGGGSKIKGVLRGIMKKLSDKPKSAFVKWRKFVDDVKKGKILNSVKAAKLAASLTKIPVRIMKDGNDRILGGGSKIKGVIRSIMKKLSDKPKSAFAKWRKFVESIKKGKILDNVKAQKLAASL